MADRNRRKNWHEIEQIGQRIRAARERLGLTQDELGERIGRTREMISRYEIGNRAVTITELPALSQALKVSIDYFFGDEVPAHEMLAFLSAELESIPAPKQKDLLELIRVDLERWKSRNPELSESSVSD